MKKNFFRCYNSLLKKNLAVIFVEIRVAGIISESFVDGEYIEELKDLELKFCGSRNQRVIDLNKTRALKKITLFEES